MGGPRGGEGRGAKSRQQRGVVRDQHRGPDSGRIGQERAVTVYRLVTKNTIEEKIVELHESKQRLARTLLEGTEEPSMLSVEELVQLIEGDGSTD